MRLRARILDVRGGLVDADSGAVLATIALSLALAACTVEPGSNPQRCDEGDLCGEGRRCFRPAGLTPDEPGFCIPRGEMDAGARDAGMPDAGMPDAGARDAGMPDAGCDRSSPSSCGSCTNVCVAPNDMCVPDGFGGFTCAATCGLTTCPSGCVDTMRDPANCGGCGVICDEGEDCIEGGCRCGATGPDCDGNATSRCCGTTCVDVNTTNAHCGGCGRACPSSATCNEQMCNCGGTLDCREICTGLACIPL